MKTLFHQLAIIYCLYLLKSQMGSCSTMSNNNFVVHPGNFQGIQVICKSWKKTYSNLYDYTAQPNMLDVKTFNIVNQTRIHKKNGHYEFIPYEQKHIHKSFSGESQASFDFVTPVEKKNGNTLESEKTFTFVNDNNKLKQQPWIAISSLPFKQYTIKQGDMLRIGKQKVRVKEIIQKGDDAKEQDEQITSKGVVYQNLTKQGIPLNIAQAQLSNYVCRFCLDNGQVGHPLMAPCNCAGSSKYVHLKCVQTWLTKTINPRSVGMATIITWKPLICELCHKTLPFKVYLDGKRYFTVNIPKPKKPYIVLNPIYRQKQPGKSKIYFLVSFSQKKEMIIGRKSDSDIIISEDSTVSRHHSKIQFKTAKNNEGKFIITDNESKFGTLVLIRKQFQMKSQLNGISIQFGGDVLQLRVSAKNFSENLDYEDLINKSQSDDSEDYQQEYQNNQKSPQNNEPLTQPPTNPIK